MPTPARKSGRTRPPAATSRRAASATGRVMAQTLHGYSYTVDTKMFALNAATGNTDPGFGKEGVVDIEIAWGGAPYVYKNLIIMGNNNGERTDGPAGDTKVYDARTGAELWRFKTMVQPGDKNYPGLWLDDSGRAPACRSQRLGLVLHRGRTARPSLHAGGLGRPAIIMEAIVPATISTGIQSSLSTPPRANTCGTSNSSTTTCGTPTCRPRPACLT